MNQNDRVVATIAISRSREVRIALGSYKGRQLVDLRLWVDSDQAEQKIPTKKGVTVPPDRLSELIAALEKVRAELRSGSGGSGP